MTNTDKNDLNATFAKPVLYEGGISRTTPD